MGTGKTTTGRRLAAALGLRFVDTDEVVATVAGKTITAIFTEDGETVFRELETAALRDALTGPPSVVATGGGIMTQPENVALMDSAGPILCLEASPETILHRTRRNRDRPLLQTADPLKAIRLLLEERRPAYAQADYRVSTEPADRTRVLEEIVATLASDPRASLLTQPVTRVQVRANRAAYFVHIEAGAYGSLGRLCPPPAAEVRCAVITSAAIAPLYGPQVMGALESGGWRPCLITVPDGEASKSLQTAAGLYDELVEAGVDGAGAVFALGGGVVGDLAGFVAATYRRGVRLAQLPTSLLAQVDASVGGKVAVDHPRGKNLIGAFYQPSAVVIDSAALQTLPDRELRSGLAEIIKHALIADRGMFEFLEQRLADFISREDVTTRYLLSRNVQIKAAVVEADPYDRAGRAALNYGHTIGHAVERAAGEWRLRHGEAVAIGMAAEARFALERGLCDHETYERQVRLLEAAGLPTAAPGLDFERAAEALQLDKKTAAGRLRLPLVPQIGRVQILEDVEPRDLLGVLESVCLGTSATTGMAGT